MTVLYFSLVKRQQSLPPLPLSPEGLLPLPFIVDYQHEAVQKVLFMKGDLQIAPTTGSKTTDFQ